MKLFGQTNFFIPIKLDKQKNCDGRIVNKLSRSFADIMSAAEFEICTLNEVSETETNVSVIWVIPYYSGEYPS